MYELGAPSLGEMLALISQLNGDPDCHGILVQAPVMTVGNRTAPLSQLTAAITPEKDVDGLSPVNIGSIACKSTEPLFYPCTPLGIIRILSHFDIAVRGKRAVVLGRSDIVGMPMALMLNRADATVTICHSQSPDIAATMRDADICVAAVGAPNFVQRSWVRMGAAVVDVGINRIASPDGRMRIVGDVDFAEVSQVAGAITPVPGGVGAMTVAMLVSNLLTAALRSEGVLARDQVGS